MKRLKIKSLFILSLIVLFLPIVCSKVFAAEVEQLQLSPMPKLYINLSEEFIMTNSINILGIDKIDKDTKNNLLDFLQEHKINVNKVYDDKLVTIILRKSSDSVNVPAIKRMIIRKCVEKPEGYLLHIEQNHQLPGFIVVEGNDEVGLFYGIQTLKQLLKQSNMTNVHIEDYPDIQARGTIEGFYGNPWTHEDRLDQLKFYGEYKLNTYIYAPKDDPYHRDKWREPYPNIEMKRMKELISVAKANKVNFVFAISPGIDIKFQGEAGEKDFQALLNKFESLYDMGVRSFAIYYDDIKDKSAKQQANVLNRLQKEFVEKKRDVSPLITVPTEYFTFDMINRDGQLKEYTKEFSNALAKSIQVMYTGPGVVCEEITESDISLVSNIYGRKMAVWWNYPVNDYFINKLALGPIYGLNNNIAKYSNCFVMNPMEHANLSKITVQTGAEYAWSPKTYEYDKAWDRALAMQYGDLAADMKIFASHSSYMDKGGWAKTGFSDAPQLKQLMDNFWTKIGNGQNGDKEIALLHKAFTDMGRAHDNLKAKLPLAILKDCEKQLELFAKLAKYDEIALKMIEAKLKGNMDDYRILRQATEKNQKEIENNSAKLSEKVAVDFLNRSLKQ